MRWGCVCRRGWLQKDLLAVKVGQLSSINTQLPYSYYSLPFCRPSTVTNSANNLGEVLRGNLIENSLYEVTILQQPVLVVQTTDVSDTSTQFTSFVFLVIFSRN